VTVRWCPGIAIAAAVTLLAGCGGGAVHTVTGAGQSGPSLTTSTSTTTAENSASARYCQLLDSGRWVTNDSPYSTTPCVPNPSFATGNEQADGTVAIPRCFTCKLSDWKRAERRAARRAGTSTTESAVSATTDQYGWSSPVTLGFDSVCTADWGASAQLCGCIANQLEAQLPEQRVPSLSADDSWVQAAANACGAQTSEP
jgi:hypothetical protein